ncbi:Phosphoglucan phosphatase LSF2, chloroplastic [Linum perenne]
MTQTYLLLHFIFQSLRIFLSSSDTNISLRFLLLRITNIFTWRIGNRELLQQQSPVRRPRDEAQMELLPPPPLVKQWNRDRRRLRRQWYLRISPPSSLDGSPRSTPCGQISAQLTPTPNQSLVHAVTIAFKSSLEWAVFDGKGRVYVHCTAGLGRAPAVIIAYMFWFCDMNLNTAYDTLTSKRPCGPNKRSISDRNYGWILVSFVEGFL